MDVPLLGSLKKTFSYLNPIPAPASEGEDAIAGGGDDDGDDEGDEDGAGDGAAGAAGDGDGDGAVAEASALSAILSFKEKLIFGSPDRSVLPWIETITELRSKDAAGHGGGGGGEEADPAACPPLRYSPASDLAEDAARREEEAGKAGMVRALHDSAADQARRSFRVSSPQGGLGFQMPKDFVTVEPPEQNSAMESMPLSKETSSPSPSSSSSSSSSSRFGTGPEEEKLIEHRIIGMPAPADLPEKSPGMYPEPVSPSSRRRHLRRIRTAPAIASKTQRSTTPAASAKEKLHNVLRSVPVSPSMSVVSQAFVGLLLYLVVGIAIYSWMQDSFSGSSSTHSFIDAIYFCIVTMCTIGYGDIAPVTPMAKLFSCAFVLIGFGFIDILLSGMVTYFLDKQESLLLSSMATGRHEIAKNYLVDTKKGRMRIRTKVSLAFGVVIMCIGVGTVVMHFLESMGWLDSFYLSCMSVTTVGYGDHAFTTISGRLFASIWLLVSTLAVARSFIFLAEARIDKRHRLIAKLMLEKEMTAGDLVAADFDNDGCVSKSDFVVYKLKQMGKIVEKDIAEVCKQFNRLDIDNSGKITLSCLIRLHEASMQPHKTHEPNP